MAEGRLVVWDSDALPQHKTGPLKVRPLDPGHLAGRGGGEGEGGWTGTDSREAKIEIRLHEHGEGCVVKRGGGGCALPHTPDSAHVYGGRGRFQAPTCAANLMAQTAPRSA